MLSRTLLHSARHARHSSSSSTSSPPPPPPRGSFFSASTVYPFVLLSAITSLALNLSHQRTAKQQETAHLTAQISVLEHLVARLPSDDDIDRELELVGLGPGKGKLAIGEGHHAGRNPTSWSEVLFGNRAKDLQPDPDDTDWEQVFREADAADLSKPTPSPPARDTLPTPVLVAPPPPPPPTSPSPSSPAENVAAPTPPPKPKQAAIYL